MPDAATLMSARDAAARAARRDAIAEFLSEAVCDACSRPASLATTVVADTDDAVPAPRSPLMLCSVCAAELAREGNGKGWVVANHPLTHRPGATEQLEALLEAAGLSTLAGYHVGGTMDALILGGPHPVVLADADGQLWLLSEVGRDGEFYPEDDLEDELDTKLPAEHELWWDDRQERAVLARRLVATISVDALKDAIGRFERLASSVENYLTSLDWPDFRPSGSVTHEVSAPDDLLGRGPLVPPNWP